MSKIAVAKEIKNKELVVLETSFLKLKRAFYLLLHKDKYRTALLNEFVNLAVQ